MKSVIYEDLWLTASGVVFQKFVDRGGEAEVWQVHETDEFHRELAAKVFTYEKGDVSPQVQERLRRFHRGGVAWHKFSINSRSVLPLHRIIDDEFEGKDGRAYRIKGFLAQFAPLGSLKKYINSDINKLSTSALNHFLREIAAGVYAGHSIDQCHGDIKPANILVFDEQALLMPKLMDFGNTRGPEDLIGGGLGSPEYMAPELFARQDVTKASDVYALGVLFYEVIVGHRPFETEPYDFEDSRARLEAYRKAHTNQTPDILPVRNRAGGEMQELIRRMLEKDAELRPEMSEVVSQLHEQEQQHIRAKEQSTDHVEVMPLRQDRYRWTPELHRDLMNRLYYFFLDGYNQTAAIPWMRNKLKEQGIHGYAFYRILGGYDYVIRVWLKGDYWTRFDQLLDDFRKTFGGKSMTFAVSGAWNWWTKKPTMFGKVQDVRQLPVLQKAALEKLAKCVNLGEKGEFEALQKAGLVHSLMEDAQSGYGQKEGDIRLFITLRSRGDNQEWQSKQIGQRLADALAEMDTDLSQVSVYSGGTDFQHLIKCRVHHYFTLVRLLDLLADETRSPVQGFSTKTFVELDPHGIVESDDGSIVLELEQYLRHRL